MADEFTGEMKSRYDAAYTLAFDEMCEEMLSDQFEVERFIAYISHSIALGRLALAQLELLKNELKMIEET